MMGNEIEAARKRIEDPKLFESYLNILKETTNKLLLKRKVDLILSKTCLKKITTKEMHIYPSGIILGKIRFRDDPEYWESTNVTLGPDEYNSEVAVDGKIMSSNLKNWTTGQIISAQRVIEEYRAKYVNENSDPETRANIDRTKFKDVWSRFVFSKITMGNKPHKQIPYKVIDDRIKIFQSDYENTRVCIGKIDPIKTCPKCKPAKAAGSFQGRDQTSLARSNKEKGDSEECDTLEKDLPGQISEDIEPSSNGTVTVKSIESSSRIEIQTNENTSEKDIFSPLSHKPRWKNSVPDITTLSSDNVRNTTYQQL